MIFNFWRKPAPVIAKLEPARYHVPRNELKMILRRGLNTLDPQKLPEWAIDLADDVESKEDSAFNIRVSK